jgi:hypothetical protein
MTALALSPAAADFDGLPVDLVDHAGQRWLIAEDAGRCLGYALTNARDAVTRLYRRHADEFTDADTCTVKLTAQGQAREFRIFSATGCVLLSMFANTAKAKAFRAWAKRVLANAPAPASSVGIDARLGNVEANLARLSGYMADLVEVSRQQARKLDVTARYIGLLEINQKGKVRVTRAVEANVLALAAQGMPQADIARLLRLSSATVNLLIHGKYRWSQSEAAKPQESVEALLERLIAEERGCLPASF